MTSSLVGSEMCIRDRNCNVLDLHGCCQSCLLKLTVSADTTERVEHPLAVSYTHLTLPTICSV
eukprot:12215659-Prorocentrum_lima.AAC.1